jgi:hypothetical protein
MFDIGELEHLNHVRRAMAVLLEQNIRKICSICIKLTHDPGSSPALNSPVGLLQGTTYQKGGEINQRM